MAFADDRQINKKQLPGEIRFESENARELMDDILKAFPDSIKRIAIKRPSLSDVYIREIGELPEEEDG